jgi:site-specific recombinase XerD
MIRESRDTKRGRYWRMRLTKAIALFAEYLKTSKAKETVAAYESDLNRFRFHSPMDTIFGVTPEAIQRWLAASSAEGNSMATLHRKLATMRAFGRWGVRKELWKVSPAETIDPIRRPKHLPRPFSDDEVAALLALVLLPREALIRGLLLFTGLRVTPICGIKVGDVSFSPPTMRVLVKGAKQQVVKLHPDLVDPLRKYITEHTDRKAQTLLFTKESGRHPHRRDLERMTKRWGERADVLDCTPHRFRHTFATKLIRAGVSPRVVKEALGHADFASTMVYTLVTDDDEAAAIARLAWETKP